MNRQYAGTVSDPDSVASASYPNPQDFRGTARWSRNRCRST